MLKDKFPSFSIIYPQACRCKLGLQRRRRHRCRSGPPPLFLPRILFVTHERKLKLTASTLWQRRQKTRIVKNPQILFHLQRPAFWQIIGEARLHSTANCHDVLPLKATALSIIKPASGSSAAGEGRHTCCHP